MHVGLNGGRKKKGSSCSRDWSLHEGSQSINWLEAEAEDASVVTDDRTTSSDKVFNLSGVIQIKRKFIKGDDRWLLCDISGVDLTLLTDLGVCTFIHFFIPYQKGSKYLDVML